MIPVSAPQHRLELCQVSEQHTRDMANSFQSVTNSRDSAHVYHRVALSFDLAGFKKHGEYKLIPKSITATNTSKTYDPSANSPHLFLVIPLLRKIPTRIQRIISAQRTTEAVKVPQVA